MSQLHVDMSATGVEHEWHCPSGESRRHKACRKTLQGIPQAAKAATRADQGIR